MRKFCFAITGIAMVLCSTSLLAQDAQRGMQAFEACAECHGASGEGNRETGAPKLAGQQGWYLGRQIKNFRDGIRGGRTEDSSGHTMSEIASNLTSDQDIRDLLAYIDTLPDVPSDYSTDGDVANGEQLYSTCSACHGENADGNPTAGAPALAGREDWYLLAQLEKFGSGVRGADRDDRHGQEMAAAATAALENEQSRKDLVAYIGTLGGE